MCWHKWSKWEEYEEHCYYSLKLNNLFYINDGKFLNYLDVRQKRYCLKCSKVQDELIR